MGKTTDRIQKIGNAMVDLFHYLALFVIGATIVWSAAHEYLQIMAAGHAALKDILLRRAPTGAPRTRPMAPEGPAPEDTRGAEETLGNSSCVANALGWADFPASVA